MRDLPKLAARDLAILAIALGVWWLAADASAGLGWWGDFTGFVAGLLLGATGLIVHEWGHLLGALVTGSKVRIAQTLRSAFVFSFDTRQNSLTQFLVMSFGGFVATGLVVWAFYTYLPDGLLATRIARGAALFGVFLGIVLEVPLVVVAIRKRAVPRVAAVRVSRRAPSPA